MESGKLYIVVGDLCVLRNVSDMGKCVMVSVGTDAPKTTHTHCIED